MNRAEGCTQQPGREHDDGRDQLQYTVDGNAHNPEGQKQQPYKRIEHQCEDCQRPAHHEQQTPQQESEHDETSCEPLIVNTSDIEEKFTSSAITFPGISSGISAIASPHLATHR